jgi:hypothetical protein
MRWVLLSLVSLAVAVTAALAACSSNDNAVVAGFVSLDAPLSEATVYLESLDGAARYGGPVTTDLAGEFTISVPGPSLPQDFRIVASGGTAAGEPFDGSLVADVYAFERDLQPFFRLNPVSTLISGATRAQFSASPGQARAEVNRYLEVPDDIDLVKDDGLSRELFDPAVFLLEARDAESFDSFVAAVVADMDSDATRTFRPVPLPPATGSIAGGGSSIVKNGMQSVAGSLGSSLGGDIGEFAATNLIGFVMDLIFPSSPEPDPLDEVKGQLDEIKKELGNINTRLTSLENSAEETNTRLRVTQYDQAIDQVLGPRNTINRNYTWLINQARTASSVRNDADLESIRQQVAADLANLLPPDSPTDEAIGTIHQLITGDLGRTDVLSAYINRLGEVLTDQNRAEVYASLESFFTTLITTQMKGVRVITEAYVARDQPLQAQSYFREFYEEQLLPELDVFTRTVEQLVLSNRKTRWSEFLPDVESQMLAKADLFVANVRNGANFDGQIVSPEPERRWAVARVAAAKGSLPSRITLLTSQGPVEVDRAGAVDSGPFSLGRYVYLNPPGDRLHFQGGGLGLSVSVNFGARPSATLNRAAWIPGQSNVFYVQGVASGKNLEFTGPSRDNGAHIQQWDWYGGDNQKWYIESAQAFGGGDKYYYNKFSNKVVDTAGGRSTPGAVVWQWERNGAEGQRSCCYFTGGFNTFKLGTGFVALEATEGVNGVNTVLIGSPGDDGSRWKAEEVEDSSRTYYKITNQATGKVLEVAGPSTENGGHLQVFPAHNHDTQKWRFGYVEQGYWTITNAYNQKVIDVSGAGRDNGASILQWDYLGNASHNQQWAMEVIAPDTFVFVNRNSGRVLDVFAATTLTGAQVYQWDWLNGDNQKWKLVKAD